MPMETLPEGGTDLKRRRKRHKRPVSWERVLQRALHPQLEVAGPGRPPWPLMERTLWRRLRGASTCFCYHPLRPGLRPRGQGCMTAVSGRWKAGPAHRDPFITHEAHGQQRPPVSPRGLSRSARPRTPEEASGHKPGQRGGHALPTQHRCWPIPCQAPPSGAVRKASGG